MKNKKTKEKKPKQPLYKKILNNSILRFCLKWGFVFTVWFLIFMVIIVAYYSKDLPDIAPTIHSKEEVNIEVLYSNGKEIKKYGNISNEITNYAEFPLHLIDSLVATEDRKFFKHGGFDYLGILRAFVTNIKAGYMKQGGSTITQQLSKMILQNSKKTLKRKVQELLLAIQLERKLTKEQIIMMYLNKAYFGAGKTGISEASNYYFDKNVSQLDLEESAMLVGLLKAPSKYSPKNNPILSKERTKQIITNMYNAGLISKNDYDKYLDSYLNSIIDATVNTEEKLNQELYFADWVKSQIPDYTNETNIEIKTTLNAEIQNKLEYTIRDFQANYKKELKESNIAVVIMDKDGAVLGMTGGIDYNKSEFNRAIYAYRQAGSLFKLFVFITGMQEQSYSPDSIFRDEPVAVGNWFPENYGNKYYGEVTMKDAFAKSLNSVAIQISEFSGVQNVAKTAKKMGITSKIDKDDPTIALGTTEVNLLELVSAYGVISNDGNAVIPYSINEIKNKESNNIIYKRKTTGLGNLLTQEQISFMKDMMYETIVNGTGKKAQIPDLIEKGSCCIGGKTGTSQNYSDAWFIGYANDITIGIWIGNDDNTSMGKTAGGTLPAILWKNIASNII